MFKAATRWRSDKSKLVMAIVVFKLQFRVSQVPEEGREGAVVVFVSPIASGKPTQRSPSSATAAADGSCRWSEPVYVTAKLVRDPKSDKFSEKLYRIVILSPGNETMEAVLDLASYADAFNPSSISLPLNPSPAGATLHITIQRVEGDGHGRELDANGGRIDGHLRVTLQSQLSNSEEGNNSKPWKDQVISDTDTGKSSSLETTSVSSLNRSSSNNSSYYQDHSNSQSPCSISSTPRNQITGLVNMPTSVPGSPSGLRERLQDPDATIEKLRADAMALARWAETSELELQSLRKQVVKESKRCSNLSKEVGRLTEERDTLRRECEELKASKDGINVSSASSCLGDEDRRSVFEETQDGNSESVLAVGESERVKMEAIPDPHDEDQYALELLVMKKRGDAIGSHSMEQEIIHLKREAELCKKDREEVETQMEQLALDYEVLKQENHSISSMLEQCRLRDQLRTQYECSSHLVIITNLEACVEGLEAKLIEKSEAFEADLEVVITAKIEQEHRAILAEEALRRTRWTNANIAERLQGEFRKLTAQISSAFDANDKLAAKSAMDVGELNLQKSHLENLVQKSEENLESVRGKFRLQVQELLSLLEVKTEESDRLLQELDRRNKELENLAMKKDKPL